MITSAKVPAEQAQKLKQCCENRSKSHGKHRTQRCRVEKSKRQQQLCWHCVCCSSSSIALSKALQSKVLKRLPKIVRQHGYARSRMTATDSNSNNLKLGSSMQNSIQQQQRQHGQQQCQHCKCGWALSPSHGSCHKHHRHCRQCYFDNSLAFGVMYMSPTAVSDKDHNSADGALGRALMRQTKTQPASWKDGPGSLMVGRKALCLQTCFMTANNAHLSITAS